jgi:hypothetical protein
VIEIPEPPNITGCAPCGSPLIWLYSARRGAWVAFVDAPKSGQHAIRPHPCRHAQDPVTWRSLDHGDPPSAEYVAAKQALKSNTSSKE